MFNYLTIFQETPPSRLLDFGKDKKTLKTALFLVPVILFFSLIGNCFH